MHGNVFTATAVAGCVIALAACVAQGTPEAGANSAGGPPPATPASQAGVTSNTAASIPAAVVERARQALHAAGLSSDLQLLNSEQVQWNDSSLGCPQPGAMYAQVITPGYVLRFADQDSTHEVHVASNAAIVCSPQLGTGVPKRPGAAYLARDLDAIVETARADLAARLNVKPEDLTLRKFEPTTWPDSRLGCGEPAPEGATQGPVGGFKLFFATNLQYYTYHTDLKRAFPCPPIATE
jgi:hypothetical protein